MAPDSAVVKGRAAIAAVFKEKFEQGCSLEVKSLRSEVAGDRAFDKGRLILAVPQADGPPKVVKAHYLAVLKRVGQEWLARTRAHKHKA